MAKRGDMIIRLFRTTIYPEMREDFERDFASISVDAVKSQRGFVMESR